MNYFYCVLFITSAFCTCGSYANTNNQSYLADTSDEKPSANAQEVPEYAGGEGIADLQALRKNRQTQYDADADSYGH